MLYRVRTKIARYHFDRAAAGIFATKAVDPSGIETDPTIVSQICHQDLAMYLLAIKSFTRFIRPRSVVALDDGSLTEQDSLMLRRHIAGIRILPITSIANPVCPRGGAWERLLFIADEVGAGYVIQLDADTLTMDRPSEVAAAIQQGSCFALGTKGGESLQRIAQIATTSRAYRSGHSGHDHIQHVSESALDRLPQAESLSYIRGCAGFAGFARFSFSRESLERFSERMASLVGMDRWTAWGSEQVSSNFMIANAPSSQVLPLARYDAFSARSSLTDKAFLHFFGAQRFQGGVYAATARQMLKSDQLVDLT